MKIVLFRHGEAVDRDDFSLTGREDALRPLTSKGRSRSRKMARQILTCLPQVDLVISSPLIRSQQTAQLISPIFKVKRRVECAELSPSASPQVFVQWLKSQLKTEKCVVVVGHEPQLSRFGTWCLVGAQDSFFELKKSGAMCMEIESASDLEPACAFLKWMFGPKQIN